MATRREKKERNLTGEFSVFEDSDEGRTAALDSMIALCPCKFNCSEVETCECGGECPCAMKGDSFCRALCSEIGFGF